MSTQQVDSFPMSDRGLAYGDGLFETILVRNGSPFFWNEHMERLADGAARLGFTPPCRSELEAVLTRAGAGLCVLKLLFTRGSGGRGYAPPAQALPSWSYHFSPFEPDRARQHQGVTVRLCALKLSIQPQLAGIKHLSRLENVLARQEWSDSRIAEGVLSDLDGHVIEATAMNVAWFDGRQWLTPRLDRCGVGGTLRRALIERGFLTQAVLRTQNLPSVQAMIVFNSVQGCWPVTSLVSADGAPVTHWALSEPVKTMTRQANALLGYD
ncbi:aminodeoxychorismate lyase [Larsenimonas suaedae]|uniref:Aminodeoxychorismate lyase n=1 Tax=Larsenimonas suaedae TaxID=1851019 RepID=A0ABU1GUW5_9GAMM|nr:aminodeoxychorismate lyase [Larsenimonas suaedae]MCM2971125.1 aminodeoxychorismate lyase [Larsenimonas suaedae]MDR5895834.1 aminodeoxychorismate lyase [Larsenimonas suaedae]